MDEDRNENVQKILNMQLHSDLFKSINDGLDDTQKSILFFYQEYIKRNFYLKCHYDNDGEIFVKDKKNHYKRINFSDKNIDYTLLFKNIINYPDEELFNPIIPSQFYDEILPNNNFYDAIKLRA